MSEYVTVETEATDNPDVLVIYINQPLTMDDEEIYDSAEAAEEDGSPLVQAVVFAVDGIAALTVRPDHMVITRQPDAIWEVLVDDLRDALRDFFL